MKFAVIGDIHGNIFALESVLQDIKKWDVDYILGTGDLVGYLPYPNEVIEKIREERIICVQGNHDEMIGKLMPEDKSYNELSQEEIQSNASRLYTNRVIKESNRDYLKKMPKSISMECGHFKIVVVHGSPENNKEYIYNDKKTLEVWSQKLECDVLICGHTHVPYLKKVSGKYFINAGSVGKPKHGNGNATYVIVEIIGEEIKYEMREVAYDIEGISKAIQNEPMISNELIKILENGC